MAASRRDRLWAWLAATEGQSLAERICIACVQNVSVSGAGMTVIGVEGQWGLVHGTDEMARQLEEVQLTLGEGPCVEAFASRGPVLVEALEKQLHRWPAFGVQAQVFGVGAVFSFPLQVGAARLGVLDLYRRAPGALDTEELADALIFADLATHSLLMADPVDPDGLVIRLDGIDTHAELYQASGMVMVQLGIGPAEAVARLRAYAFANDLLVTDVARQVIFQQLRLEGDLT